MIVSDMKITLIDRQWYLVSASEQHGPYASSAAAIKARQELAQVDVTATAAKVGRKQQRERVREEW
jgi:hypothetical protein